VYRSRLAVVWASVRLWRVVTAIDSELLAAMGTEVSREAGWRGCGPVPEMKGGNKDGICLALAFWVTSFETVRC
jgi:hypothetical protein